jgi:hypothetical protein
MHRPSTGGDSYRGRWDRLTGFESETRSVVVVDMGESVVDVLEPDEAEKALRLGIRRIL